MLKKIQVILLPTNQKTDIALVKSKNLLFYLPNGDLVFEEDSTHIGQHFYFLSNDEIKNLDWFINNQGLWQCNNGIIPKGLNPKKVIATTNSSLKVEDDFDIHEIPTQLVPVSKALPQPSQSFIEKYVERYNAGNPITDVMVEYYFTHETNVNLQLILPIIA
jgi:hypothetical protein